MAVTQADLSFKRAESSSSDPLTNGGYLTTRAIGTTLFSDVSGAERAAGLTRWRKVFLKNEAGTGTIPEKVSDPLLGLVDAKVFLYNTSAGDDYFLIKAASVKSGVQDDETDAAWGATGELIADALQNATTLQVRCELNGSAGELFVDGGTVLVVSGTQKEFLTLNDPGGVSWNGAVATLTFTATPLQHDYYAILSDTADIYTANSVGTSGIGFVVNEHVGRRVRITAGTGIGQRRRIISNTIDTLTVEFDWATPLGVDTEYTIDLSTACQCVSFGTIECAYTAPVVTGSGSFTPGITLYPVGCVDDSWTLLMSGTPVSAYSITGTKYGSLGVFNIGSDAKPTNGSSFYFKISASGFGGTFTAGDTIQFDTVSASGAFWIKQVVPAGADAHLANSIDIGASGDTI